MENRQLAELLRPAGRWSLEFFRITFYSEWRRIRGEGNGLGPLYRIVKEGLSDCDPMRVRTTERRPS